ncbi:MAG: MBL fold metallo-hydrolase [Armatimonadota bacterium]|nr:MBL fold metallo-hydrolase [Armatimonadota bacterium]MDR7422195.1 MBL fold metallo-hydrolase [Armatimonadota bacterium]MDR7453092.1 MBL fold metallo-hydrolase [Armatimonadota bacterium]MDR7457693.1 MBL fold metallo-hydrolase [Armatimonadota bacterium]MDR7495782.1 MBL fold metallo-hydrolase [Armatimonadota bacterium]
MEVAPGIHRIALSPDLATYALVGERVVLVDAGFAGAARTIDRYLRGLGRSVAEVALCVITHAHADHFGGAAEILAAAPGAVLAAHAADAPWIEDPARHLRENYGWSAAYGLPHPDALLARIRAMLGPGATVGRALADGDAVDAGGWTVRVHHAPGHSRGHLVLLDPRSGSLLAGDAVADPTLNPPIYYDAMTYRDTLRRLDGLAAARLLSCHMPVLERPVARALLADALAHVEACHRLARDAFAAARDGLTLPEVASALLAHTGVGEEPRRWAWAAHGHVQALVAEGAIARRPGGGLPAWEMRR